MLDGRAQTLHDSPMPTQERPRTPAYLWFDSEYTSLDPGRAHLLQVALLVTDPALRRLTPPARDVNLYIRLAPDAPVSDWVASNMAGVLRQCRSEDAVPVKEADRRLAALVDEAMGRRPQDVKQRPVLAGNTVHMDMALIRMFLPAFAARLHYRLLDVSTLKILWQDSVTRPLFDKAKPGLIAQYLRPT